MDLARTLQQLVDSPDFTEIRESPRVRLDLRYAGTNNFTGKNLYGAFNRAFLHAQAAEGLALALKELERREPRFKIIVYDALRPRSIQRILWAEVAGTVNEPYLANPDRGSLHNFGFAVDLSLLDPNGRELDMGAGFDDFREIAHPAREGDFLKTGELTREHIAHRELLREIMRAGGFKPLAHEWWHFDFLTRSEAEAKFKIVE